jgi:D-alanyl-D-alanine carboxypeptidase/D-alanyl-D-alanine-endopeptidase (penicillin-binding protein 4)
MLEYARERIQARGLKPGRHVIFGDSREAALYAGKLLLSFLQAEGLKGSGKIRFGRVNPQDELILAHRSPYSLAEALQKMLEFSSNFMANQIFVALGAALHGPPGTMGKGTRVVAEYARGELELKNLEIVEGSGISRRNRISASEMAVILKHFQPYRRLLNKQANVYFKTGTLQGIRAMAGYLEPKTNAPHAFVIFLNRSDVTPERLVQCLERTLLH